MAAKTEAWTYFRAKDDGFTMILERMEKKTSDFSRKSKKNIDSVSYSFKKLRSDISSLSGSLGNMPLIGGIGAAGLYTTGKKALEKFATRESQETSIKFLSKTEEEGKSNLAFLRKLSNDYGVEFGGMLDGYKQLKANMNMMNIAPEEQNAKFKKISAAIRVMGLDAQQSGSVFYAFSQMMSKGQIQAQELKLQLANVFPAAVPILAKSMGKSVGDLNKMLDAGVISWKKYGDNFINYIYDNVKDGIPNAVNNLSAGLARASNTWEDAWVKMGDSIAASGVLDFVTEIGTELGNWAKDNKEMISSTIKGGVDWMKGAFEWGIAHKDEIGSLLTGIGIFIAAVKTANLMMMFTNPIVAAAAGLALVVVAIDQALKEIEKANALEKTKDQSKNRTYTGYGAGESLVIGGKNLFKGAWNTTFGGDPIKGVHEIIAGGSQIGLGVAQGAALYNEKVSENVWGYKQPKISDNFGRAAMRFEKGLNPQDFRADIPTQSSAVPSFMNESWGVNVKRDDTKQENTDNAIAMAKIIADAVKQVNIMVNSGDSKIAFSSASGQAIKPQSFRAYEQ